jgi:hypothetical protein
MYDVALGRWHVMDPLAEEYYSQSSFHFSGNNPLVFLDANGMNYNPIYDFNGNYLGSDELGFTGEIMFMTQENFEFAGGEGMSHDNALYYGDLFSEVPEGFLSLESYANVWNHITSAVPGVDLTTLPSESVSIFDGTYYQLNDNFGTIKYGGFNEPSNATGSLASVPYDEDKITINFSNKRYLRTVENVQNALGDHEFMGHIIMDYNDKTNTHHLVYEFQMSRPSWKNTTPDYKELIIRNYQKYLRIEK